MCRDWLILVSQALLYSSMIRILLFNQWLRVTRTILFISLFLLTSCWFSVDHCMIWTYKCRRCLVCKFSKIRNCFFFFYLPFCISYNWFFFFFGSYVFRLGEDLEGWMCHLSQTPLALVVGLLQLFIVYLFIHSSMPPWGKFHSKFGDSNLLRVLRLRSAWKESNCIPQGFGWILQFCCLFWLFLSG